MKILKFGLLVVLLTTFVASCSYLNKKVGLQDDNTIEEAIEDAIQDRFGLDIDLTP